MYLRYSALLLVIMIWVYKCNKSYQESKSRLIVTPIRDNINIIYRTQNIETNPVSVCLMCPDKLYWNSRSPYWHLQYVSKFIYV
jgi:hypothetical protein